MKQPKRRWILIAGFVLLVFLGIALWQGFSQSSQRVVSSIPEDIKPQMTYEVINAYPHDPQAFTQGLIYLDGWLYESAGLYGQSSLRKVVLETGEVLQQVNLPEGYFAEGLTSWNESLVQLTWRESVGFIYDRETFSQIGQFTYETEGWGLTTDGERWIMSDGTARLTFLDPQTFNVVDTITVQDEGIEVQRLNELEFVCGEIFANIWQTDSIIRIDPQTGSVTGWIDMRGLRPEDTDVLNGIAYDPEQDRLFVTGKLWPWLYEIRLIP